MEEIKIQTEFCPGVDDNPINLQDEPKLVACWFENGIFEACQNLESIGDDKPITFDDLIKMIEDA